MPLYETNREPEPCLTPCRFSPGSREKVEMMRWRCSCGESLYHADDCRCPLPPKYKAKAMPPSALREYILTGLGIECH